MVLSLSSPKRIWIACPLSGFKVMTGVTKKVQGCRLGRFLLLGVLILAGQAAPIPPASAEALPQPRTVLALLDDSEFPAHRIDSTLIHRHVEMVLNHLGLKVRYRWLSEGLPGEEDLKDVRGILTWFRDDTMTDPETYVRWAAARIQSGFFYAMLGYPGFLKDTVTGRDLPLETVNKVFVPLGFSYESQGSANPLTLRVVSMKADKVQFERSLEGELEEYTLVRPLTEENEVLLELERTDLADSRSALVAVGPRGGLALLGYEMFVNESTDEVRWRIDPFYFFERTLGLQGEPRFDTTTLWGRRILYVHVDGDGFRNISQTDNKSYASEILLRRILEVYRLPTAVSVITAEVDPHYLGNETLLNLARQIFRLKHVEAGIHGFTHPLQWEKKLTAFAIKGYSSTDLKGSDEPGLADSHYPNAAYIDADQETYLHREIEEPMNFVNRELLPPGKRVRLEQWTGNCKPPAEAIALADQLGLSNINGGDSRFDRAFPSYGFVAPLARQKDGRLQIYSSNANENIYTDGWHGPFYGFRYVLETFDQTETPTLTGAAPRRVSPVNIYYHFYSAERKAGLDTLQTVYHNVLKRPLVPVYPSYYASVATAFFEARVSRTDDGGWEFEQYGPLQTVRFDQTALWPDLERSRGITGFKRRGDTLYVSLASTGHASLYLTGKEPDAVYLEEASSLIREEVFDAREIHFETDLFGRALYVFRNMKPSAVYRVLIQAPGDERPFFDSKAVSDGAGRLEIQIPEAPVMPGAQVQILEMNRKA